MKLIMCQGLPGSGKSWWAAEQAKAGPVEVVEKDRIRADLAKTGWTWSPEAEKRDVIPLRDTYIEDALGKGLDVISADTNFQRDHRVQLEKLARRHGASFEIKRFDVPLDVCLSRNAGRETGRVPESVIREMHIRHIMNAPSLWPLSADSPYRPKPVERDEGLMPALICDLDGTLARIGNRSPYDASQCDVLDAIYGHVRRLIRTYSDWLGFQIIYMSGREEKDREPTERFLRKYDCPPGPLWMRTTGDKRKDRIVKLELFDAHVRGKYQVEFVLDDRDQVVQMWRELGLPCFQVAEGRF